MPPHPTTTTLRLALATLPLLALTACNVDYRPGVSGARPILNQNLPANAVPEAPGARPR